MRAHERFCGDGAWRKDGTHQDRIFWVHHDPCTGRAFLVVYAQLAPYNAAKWDMSLWATYCDGVRFVLLPFFLGDSTHLFPVEFCADNLQRFSIPFRRGLAALLREKDKGHSTPHFFLRLHLAFEVERRLVGREWFPHSQEQVKELEITKPKILDHFLGGVRSTHSEEQVCLQSRSFFLLVQAGDFFSVHRSQILQLWESAVEDSRRVRRGILCWRALLEKNLCCGYKPSRKSQGPLERREHKKRMQKEKKGGRRNRRRIHRKKGPQGVLGKRVRGRTAGRITNLRRFFVRRLKEKRLRAKGCWNRCEEALSIFTAPSSAERVAVAEQLMQSVGACGLYHMGEMEGQLLGLGLGFLPAWGAGCR